MRKEQLFDFLCIHFGEEINDIESMVFEYLYGFLISSKLDNFYPHLKTLLVSWEKMYKESKVVNEKMSLTIYISSVLKVMNFINEQSGKEIFKW